MSRKSKIGLALSGGGYRAAGFHLGTLKKLNELGILDKVHVISSVSGGSIASVFYLLHKDNFEEFCDSFEIALQKSTVTRILLSTGFIIKALSFLLVIAALYFFLNWITATLCAIILVILLFIFLYSFISFSDLAELAYKKIFFGDKKLIDLPFKPIAAINSSNLETGTPFTFSKVRMGDSTYSVPDDGGEPIKFKVGDFPLSVAVAASAAVPFPFNPIKLYQKHFANPDDYKKRAYPSLVDGGVYDNQGIHKLTVENSMYLCDIVICSDGSMPFEKKFYEFNPLPILTRVNNIMMNRIKNLQTERNVYRNATGKVDEIAFFSINWEYDQLIDDFMINLSQGEVRESVLKAHNIPESYYDPKHFKYEEIKEIILKNINFSEITKNKLTSEEIAKICKLKTALNGLSKEEIELLSRHASILTEIQIRIYCPSLMTS